PVAGCVPLYCCEATLCPRPQSGPADRARPQDDGSVPPRDNLRQKRVQPLRQAEQNCAVLSVLGPAANRYGGACNQVTLGGQRKEETASRNSVAKRFLSWMSSRWRLVSRQNSGSPRCRAASTARFMPSPSPNSKRHSLGSHSFMPSR